MIQRINKWLGQVAWQFSPAEFFLVIVTMPLSVLALITVIYAMCLIFFNS